MFLNFGDVRFLIFWILITVAMLAAGFWKKKSIFPAIMLGVFVLLLIIHAANHAGRVNLYIDAIGMSASIASYLIIDEIEIRRKKITQVFEDRYKD